MYNTALFDLDGTLINSEIGITDSVAYALSKFGIIVEDKKTLKPFIGPPLAESFSKFYGFSEEKATEAVTYYREYFSEKGIYENPPYEGVEEMLINLKNHGISLMLATSKYEVFAKVILEHLGFANYFDLVVGSLKDGSRGSKKEVIEYILAQKNISDLSSVVMVGDRKHDMIGAKETTLDAIGVLYGFGDREELSSHGATYIAKTPSDVFDIIVHSH